MDAIQRATPASRWEEIVQHVPVSRAPRGRLCIRNKKRGMVKVRRTAAAPPARAAAHTRLQNHTGSPVGYVP